MVLEVWKRHGRVEVLRDEKGRFLSWHRIIFGLRGKSIAVFGRAMVDGRVSSRRIEIRGTGKDRGNAVSLAVRYPPKRRFTTVSARRLIENPSKYLGGGKWVGRPEVES